MATTRSIDLAVVGTVISTSLCSAQTGTLDQHSPMSTANYNLTTPTQVWQQQVRAGLAGQLEGITLTFTGDVGAQAEIRIRTGPAWSTATPAFATTVAKSTPATEAIFIDTTAANLTLAVGDTFVIESQGNGSGMGIQGSYVEPPGTPAYPEPLWRNTAQSPSSWRHGFQTWMLEGNPPCYANCDSSTTPPTLNVDDFTCFINSYAAAQQLPHAQQIVHYANCDGSTTAPALNVDDFTCFINSYAQGCP